MRRADNKSPSKGKKIIIRIHGKESVNSISDEMKDDCGEDSSLLACPASEANQEQIDVLTDDLDAQKQALERDKQDKKRRDKQVQTDAAKLKIAQANDKLMKLAGIQVK